MKSGRFDGNAPPNRVDGPTVSMTAERIAVIAAETCPLPRKVRQKCSQNCCQIMTSGQYEGIITPFEGTGMKSGRFEGNAPPNRVDEPAVSMTAARIAVIAAEPSSEQSSCSKNGGYCR